MDYTVHGVTKSQTRLSNFHFLSFKFSAPRFLRASWTLPLTPSACPGEPWWAKAGRSRPGHRWPGPLLGTNPLSLRSVPLLDAGLPGPQRRRALAARAQVSAEETCA